MVWDGDPSAVGLVALAALAGALGNAIDPVAIMAWIHPVSTFASRIEIIGRKILGVHAGFNDPKSLAPTPHPRAWVDRRAYSGAYTFFWRQF